MRSALHRIFFCLLSTAILLGTLFCNSVWQMNRNISREVFRLHILANSDSPRDQALKLKVRDRILSDWGFLFAESPDAKSSAEIAGQYAPFLRQTAQAELRRQGCLAPVSVKIARDSFPTKAYGGVRLPAGQYTALRIQIGAAAGQNWWCVLYPPLCLTGGALQADAETLRKLRQELTPEEYALVTETESLQVKMKFRLAEILGRRNINR